MATPGARQRLLLALATAAPRCVTHAALRAAVYQGDEGPEDEGQVIRVLLCHVRRRHGRDVIRNAHGLGYAMSPSFAREVLEIGAEPILTTATRNW